LLRALTHHSSYMKDIYLLSGLGADKRVYDFIDLSGHNLTHVEWIAPLDSEPLENYAKRLAKQIHSKEPVLIGVSFGGMMAIELGKLVETEKIILISSAKTRFDIPFYFRFIGWLKLHKLVPTALLKDVNWLTYWLFGAESASERKLLTEIIKDTDPKFLKWAIDKIVTWRNEAIPSNVKHIHGTRDRLLPFRAADFKIDNGGHLMIVNNGKEISDVLRKTIL
jgi:pimeloyl-ACP methyl ester carboxylesterase